MASMIPCLYPPSCPLMITTRSILATLMPWSSTWPIRSCTNNFIIVSIFPTLGMVPPRLSRQAPRPHNTYCLLWAKRIGPALLFPKDQCEKAPCNGRWCWTWPQLQMSTYQFETQLSQIEGTCRLCCQPQWQCQYCGHSNGCKGWCWWLETCRRWENGY